ncbi:MAG: hypothetical protein PSX36_07165 [bacterium]|nr:hypothetical protein [bacterium]
MAEFTINSETHDTQSNLKSLFEFLIDFRNFKSILPEEKVENFEFTTEQCSFSIKGVTPMTITLKEKHPFSYVIFQSDGLAKFNFSLKVNLLGDPDHKGKCQIDLIGDLNPFIKTMVEKQLSALVNTMSSRLSVLAI